MRTDFICHGCNYNVQEDDSGHKGYCNHCHAKGIGLPQIKKVEKWEARDGSFHDSLEDAEQHQLKAELETALRVGEGYVQRQAAHLLSHFNIVRKGDVPKGVVFMPLFQQPDLMESVKPALWFWGGFLLALVCCGLLYYFAG